MKNELQTHPLIITCALVGAELSRKELPHLPITPDELAQSAKEAVLAGAHIIHLHVRDENGHPTQRVDVFKTVYDKIRQQCDCIVQFSTGGAVGTPVLERVAPLCLRPDMATLSMGTMNFGPDIYENSQTTILAIAKAISEYQIIPELEIFDYGMLDTLKRFAKKKYLPDKFHINFVLGVPGGADGSVSTLVWLARQLPLQQTWSVAGIGKAQLPLAACAIAMGGHVRVGFEDNIFYRKHELASSNAQLVKRVVRLANELDRPLASLKQAKKILNLPV